MGEFAKEMEEFGIMLVNHQDDLIASLRAICITAHKKAGGGYWMVSNAEIEKARSLLKSIDAAKDSHE